MSRRLARQVNEVGQIQTPRRLVRQVYVGSCKMIIYGFRSRESTVNTGLFECPRCGTTQPYQLIAVKRWFTLYFIPIFPLGTQGRYVQCSTCAGTYAEDVLPILSLARDEAVNAELVDSAPTFGSYGTGPAKFPSFVPEVSALATTSLVLGILSPLLCLCGLSAFTSLAAVVCGHVALVRIGRSAGALEGRGRAIAGAAMGYSFFILSLVGWFYAYTVLNDPQFAERRADAVRDFEPKGAKPPDPSGFNSAGANHEKVAESPLAELPRTGVPVPNGVPPVSPFDDPSSTVVDRRPPVPVTPASPFSGNSVTGGLPAESLPGFGPMPGSSPQDPPWPPPGPPTPSVSPSSSETRPLGGRRSSPVPARTPTVIHEFPEMGWPVTSLAYSPNGRWLAVGKLDRTLILIDAQSGVIRERKTDLRDVDQVTALAFSPGGGQLFVGGSSGTLESWTVDEQGALQRDKKLTGHGKAVRCLASRPDGSVVVSGGDDRRLMWQQTGGSRNVRTLDTFEAAVQAVYLKPQSVTALVSDGRQLAWVDMRQAAVERSLPLLRSSCHAVAFSADGTRLACSEGYRIHVWETESGKRLHELDTNHDIQWSVAFSPVDGSVFSGGRGTLSVWRQIDGERLALAIHDALYVRNFAVAPDGKSLAVIPSSAGQTLKIIRLGE